jgi:excisionase family DNA binding protein
MNPHGCSLFVPETGRSVNSRSLTFGRPPHRQLWRGCAARMAGGEALPGVVSGGKGPSGPELLGARGHLHAMKRKLSSPAFFTERTLAAYLAVSDRTIRNWIRRGELPSYKLGAARRIDPADVETFLARHRDEAA